MRIFNVFTLALAAYIASMHLGHAKNIVVFDSERYPAAGITNLTAHWIQGSDLIAVTSDDVREGEKRIKFHYTGEKGIATSRIATITTEQIQSAAGESIAGLTLKLFVEGNTPRPILILIMFEDKSELHCKVYLKPGETVYKVESGYRRDNAPFDWNKIRTVFFRMQPDCFVNNETPVFYLKEIAMTTASAKYKTERKVTITQKRKIQEINAVAVTSFPDDLIAALRSGQKLSFAMNGGASCPVTAFAGFDAENIYILWEAMFDKEPIAGITEKDGPVYEDEAVELFFNGMNDNNNFIQFVVNAKSTVFDFYHEYDAAVVGMVNNIKKDVPHKKHISYEGNVLRYLFAFPLSGLNVRYPSARICGFQGVQNYKGDRQFDGKNLATVKWNTTSKNPDPFTFGALVLNQTKAASGSVDITSISAKDIIAKEGSLSDFIIDYTVKGLAPGEYAVRAELADAEFNKFSSDGTLSMPGDTGKYSFTIPRVKNNIGLYTVYLSIVEKNGTAIVAGVNFQNTVEIINLFGSNFIYPTPKEALWCDGVFKAGMPGNIIVQANATARTKKTATIFQDMLFGHTGKRYEQSAAAVAGMNSIRLSIGNKTVFNGKAADLNPEGYHVKVTPSEVVITGADEPGLFYGCSTFIKLIKMPMKIQNSMPVQCVDVLDWPDYSNRALRIEPSLNWGSFFGGDMLGTNFFIDLFQKHAVNNYYNYIIWDFSPLVRFQFPELQDSNRILSMDDVRFVTEYCRDRFVGIIPKIQIGGHANWWMGKYFSEFRAKGYVDMADPTHPDHDKVLYACLDEILSATHAKYLQTGDEWWFKRKTDEATASPIDSSKTWSEVFLACCEKLNSYLNAKGTRLLLFEDMLTPNLSGLKNDNYLNIDKLAKNIIITPWCSAGAEKSAAFFLEKGFEVWGNPTYDWRYRDENIRKKINGYGPSLYSYGGGAPTFKNPRGYSENASVLYGAEFAWNGKHTGDATIPEEICSGKLVEAAYINAVMPNPFAYEQSFSVSLKGNVNSDFNKFIANNLEKYSAVDLGISTAIGNIDTEILTGGNNCIRISGDTPAAKINIGKKCASLIFLHSAFQKPSATANTIKKYGSILKAVPRWPRGFPCGDYEIAYDDGTTVKAPIRLFNNIYWMDADPVNALVTLNNRYVYGRRTSSGQELFFYQWEWVNPYPQKKIASVTCFNSYGFDFESFLFALSGREIQ